MQSVLNRKVSKLLLLTALALGLLALPATAFGQTTPGAGGQTVATLTVLPNTDPSCTVAGKPDGAISLVFCGRATGNNTVNLPTDSLGVAPQDLGVFEVGNAAMGNSGLQLTGLLNDILFQASSFHRVAATYTPATKTLNFTAKQGSVYAVFSLAADAPRTLPDSGGATTSENNTLWLALGLVCLVAAGGSFGWFAYRRKTVTGRK